MIMETPEREAKQSEAITHLNDCQGRVLDLIQYAAPHTTSNQQFLDKASSNLRQAMEAIKRYNPAAVPPVQSPAPPPPAPPAPGPAGKDGQNAS
jgi:uncharacterized coiled-coil protein SlyX